jgi:heme oxygenase (biliverdin-producing, ferredoxin)
LTTYLERIRDVSNSDEPERLLAHAYVRYLGDLSGGQFIRRRLMKAYDLPDSGEGSSSFDFGTLDGSGEGRANMAEMKKIKIWYRDGMNAGAGDDEAVKRRIVEEAGLAFELNTGLFDELREPGSTSVSASASNGHTALREEEPYSPLMTKSQLLAAEDNMRDQERSAAGSMVVSLLVAAAVAHLALTLFGLSGQKAASYRVWVFLEWIWGNARGVFGGK